MKFSMALPTHPDGEPIAAALHDGIAVLGGLYLQPCVTDFWIASSVILGAYDA
jgi:hypothetical protein